MNQNTTNGSNGVSRRDFVKTVTVAGVGGLLSGCQTAGPMAQHVSTSRPNILLIICDQLSLDAISGHGCPYVSTPNIDRLIDEGVSFMNSYCTNPVCSPSRSSIFTSRMPCETGVISNSRPIDSSVPNLGQWMCEHGYETYYCGKWHMPDPKPIQLKGFTVFSSPSSKSFGVNGDRVISRNCEAFLKERSANRNPFLYVASFIQPHDICSRKVFMSPLADWPYDDMTEMLPDLPENFSARPLAPEEIAKRSEGPMNELQWKYYRYFYFRQIEMVDAEVGRVLDALEDSGLKDNTVVMFTTDHGDGAARHSTAGKGLPYEESVRVPMILSCPDRIAGGVKVKDPLVSGLDVMHTVCDYAGIDAPQGSHGLSLKPWAENRKVPWRNFIMSEFNRVNRMLRTERFKYVKCKNDPIEMLIDMKNDPLETTNLINDSKYGDELVFHRSLLAKYESGLNVVEPTPHGHTDQKKRR